jgi:hypothetical protein
LYKSSLYVTLQSLKRLTDELGRSLSRNIHDPVYLEPLNFESLLEEIVKELRLVMVTRPKEEHREKEREKEEERKYKQEHGKQYIEREFLRES